MRTRAAVDTASAGRRVARAALGASAAVLAIGGATGQVVLAAEPVASPSLPEVVAAAAPAPTMGPAQEGGWAGASVVRRRGAPDHFVRPPDEPYGAFTLAVTGDLLIHTPVWTRAALPGGGFDFRPQLADARPDIAGADLGLCHLEVPLDPDGPYSSYPSFNAPAELAEAIHATGWDVCSTASNHSVDKGFGGLVTTLDVLDAAGVDHVGTYRTEAESRQPRIVRVNGVDVGLISATYGLNGLPYPGGHTWSVQLIDTGAILARAESLRAAGAEVVLASLHWGNEYQHQPSAFQRDVAGVLMADGAIDAIIGHHAHVVQPVEWINDRPVVYGLGNFLSGQRPTERRDGAVVTLEFVEGWDGWWVDAVHAQPTWVDDAYRVVTADPGQGGVLGASAQRTLGYLGVPQSPPPPPPKDPPRHFER